MMQVKRIMGVILVLCMLLLGCASTVSAETNQISRLKVSGTRLQDENGNFVQLRGLSTHGLGWFPQYVNSQFFTQMKNDFGVNAVRLALYTEEYNGYCGGGNKKQLKDLVKQGIELAKANQMYVIVDWHILSDGNPNTHKEDAKAFFNEISSEYASCPNVIYEICNEPNGGTSWSEIKRYAEEVIPVIRANAPQAVILVGTPNWSQFVDQAAADPITGYENLMYTLHFYAATHKEELRNTMKTVVQKGLPVFVTEFGICDASGNGAIDEAQADAWIQEMNQYGVSYMMWNISNKNETSAIILPSCSKASGFTEADLSSSGKWFLKMMKSHISTGTGQMPAETTTTNQTMNQITNTNGAICTEAVLVNSWESQGKKYEQYQINITNQSSQTLNGWSAVVDLGYKGKISQSWCGSFCMEGSLLKISPVEYNREIKPGQKLENVGLIVEQ